MALPMSPCSLMPTGLPATTPSRPRISQRAIPPAPHSKSPALVPLAHRIYSLIPLRSILALTIKERIPSSRSPYIILVAVLLPGQQVVINPGCCSLPPRACLAQVRQLLLPLSEQTSRREHTKVRSHFLQTLALPNGCRYK